jgi:peptidoglycan/xylan/chitin deacetylase (PgdA/CDA1 family)
MHRRGPAIKQYMPHHLHLIATLLAVLLIIGAAPTRTVAQPQPHTESATIARWQGDAKAVFLIMFDDSWPSHFEVAMPELVKRDMIATFYINPGKGEFLKFKDKWENEIWKTGMVYGNHTMTHGGVRDVAHAEQELGLCTEAILKMVGPTPRLISYAQPGVGPGKWNITKEQLHKILKDQHLIDRPPFAGHGAVYQLKKPEEMLALADKAIAAGGMEYLVIHGVERRAPLYTGYQDFWALNQDVFRTVLDGLSERRARGELWITDHISYHKYLTERDTAKVRTVAADGKRVQLALSCDADPKLYDQPLTIIATVPAAWNECQVVQGERRTKATASEGILHLSAIPNAGQIDITPVGESKAE